MQYRLLLLCAITIAACRNTNPTAMTPTASAEVSNPAATMTHPHTTRSAEPLPVEQLTLARRAALRYQNPLAARADGYADINVVLPNMGRHFLKESLLDGTFDAEHPELLVYNQDSKGRLTLVAVEYAVPRNLSATAPDGFNGNADEWFDDQVFKLWTLHAWLFSDNPNGVFNPTNSRVP